MQQPEFITADLQTIINELIAAYETDTGRKTVPGQNERLILNEIAYREFLLRTQIQAGCIANLVDFAIAPNLDYLASLVGVTRLPAAFAVTTLRFTLTSFHNDGTIPSGKRVSTNDGKCYFTTLENVNFLIADTQVDVAAVCSIEGSDGNGYIAGSINKLIDTMVFVSSVTNLTESAGGDDQETDAALRERIKIAPESFSCAGSRGSYEFYARSASSLIVDVFVTSENPGEVLIYPLCTGGEETPSEILNAVTAACSDETVRPLCDTVIVETPTKVNYDIDATVKIKSTAVWTTVLANIEAALDAFCTTISEKIGEPVYEANLIAVIMAADENVVNVTTSFTDEIPEDNEFLVIDTITITQNV